MSKALTKTVVVTALISFGLSTVSHAQYAGSFAQIESSVAEILKNPVDDLRVVLRGYLLKQVGHEKYLFSDGTGQIRVEIDREDFRGVPVNEKSKVELIGEIEKGYLISPEVDVDVIKALSQ